MSGLRLCRRAEALGEKDIRIKTVATSNSAAWNLLRSRYLRAWHDAGAFGLRRRDDTVRTVCTRARGGQLYMLPKYGREERVGYTRIRSGTLCRSATTLMPLSEQTIMKTTLTESGSLKAKS